MVDKNQGPLFCFEQKTKQKNINTKFLNTKRLTWILFSNKQPLTKSGLKCKPTLKSSEVEAFVSILRHKILMKYIGMRPQFRKAVALIKVRIQIPFALICIINLH